MLLSEKKGFKLIEMMYLLLNSAGASVIGWWISGCSSGLRKGILSIW